MATELNNHNRKKVLWALPALILMALIIPLTFQSCGDGFLAVDNEFFSSNSFGAVFDKNCHDNQAHDACLFFKNPVHHGKSVLAQPLTNDQNISDLQTWAVELKGLNSSGYLENDTLIVNSYKYPRVERSADNNWKFLHTSGEAEKLGQVMAYYWGQTFVSYLKQLQDDRLIAIENKGVKIFTDAPFSGWSSDDNAIYLLTDQQGRNAAMNAGMIVHLLAEAHIYYKTNGQIYDLTGDSSHVDCGPKDGPVYKNDCCSDKNGCSSAISAGAADYMVAMMFPDSPTVGEAFSNRLRGLDHCGGSRSLGFAAFMTADQAYSGCLENGNPGQIYSMGSFYASIWWAVRKKAAGQDSGSEKDIDKIFLQHLSQITGRSNFLSVSNFIKSIDDSEFEGKYQSLFADEFTRRGLTF